MIFNWARVIVNDLILDIEYEAEHAVRVEVRTPVGPDLLLATVINPASHSEKKLRALATVVWGRRTTDQEPLYTRANLDELGTLLSQFGH